MPIIFVTRCTKNNDINSLSELRNGKYKIGALNLTYCQEIMEKEFKSFYRTVGDNEGSNMITTPRYISDKPNRY